MNLYRASEVPEAWSGACFTESVEDAAAYLYNPGFGGDSLYRFDVDVERYGEQVIDATTRQGLADLLAEQREWVNLLNTPVPEDRGL